MNRILAIDPATKCGYALYDNGATISGVWDLGVKRYEGGGMRFIRLENHLAQILPVDMVGFEESVNKYADANKIYGGIIAVIQAQCEKTKSNYGPVHWATIKRHATGKGNANKEMMIAAAHRLYPGRTIADDNEADALCLLNYLVSEYVK
jgi:Holliday junction resolvasome RuvABC endonuclease subunit